MEEIVFQAERRNVIGKQAKQLRREGRVPAILYGKSFEPVPVTMDLREVSRALTGITPSQLITIRMDGEEHTALVRERQRDPIRQSLLHVDFQVVSMTETLRTNVAIELIGEAPAVTEQMGVLVTGLEVLEVEALPRALPERFTIDISGLNEIGDAIYVKDVKVSDDVSILTDPEEMIVLTTFQTMEELEEEEEEEEEVELTEPELIERGSLDEEEAGEAEEL